MSASSSVRACAHRVLQIWLTGVGCVIAASALAQSLIRSIDVTYDGTTYVVKARMFAPVSQAIAWDVLTDFANMAAWVPNVSQSSVVKSGDKQMTIEQHGTAKFGG